MKQLERLLFLQGNRCFLCGGAIPEGEASVEHLVATSNGGAKVDDNCIVCCKAVNAALGNLSIKAKLQTIVNHRGGFRCPLGTAPGVAANSDQPPAKPSSDRVALVIADLQKRGPSKPRRVATLKNTVNSLFQMSLSEQELDSLLAEMLNLGYLSIEDTKVSYALPTDA